MAKRGILKILLNVSRSFGTSPYVQNFAEITEFGLAERTHGKAGDTHVKPSRSESFISPLRNIIDGRYRLEYLVDLWPRNDEPHRTVVPHRARHRPNSDFVFQRTRKQTHGKLSLPLLPAFLKPSNSV